MSGSKTKKQPVFLAVFMWRLWCPGEVGNEYYLRKIKQEGSELFLKSCSFIKLLS